MTQALQLPLAGYCRPASAQSASPWLLVLMHGVGSNAEDLFGLAPHIPAQFHVISLQAPYAMGQNAFAWFQFSVLPDGSRTIDQEQEAHSRELVQQTIRAASEQLGVPADRVLLGGFSQGGIMSLSLLLTQPELMQGIVVWHSRLLPEAVVAQKRVEAFAGKSVWLSHGTQDNVIPLANAHAIRDHLALLPLDLAYSEYPCVHTIHPDELRASMAWLEGLTKGE